MASDPFYTFSAALTSSLASARQLSTAYANLLASSGSSSSPQLITAHDRLNDALEALNQDVEDVQQSVSVVRRSPERFGVDSQELKRREEFLRQCERDVAELQGVASARGGGGGGNKTQRGYTSIDMDRTGDDDEEDHNTAFEREQQTVLMSQQDTTLFSIGRTLTSLKSQASNMGNEIGEQVDLVKALDTEVESSQTKLGRAMGRLDELVRRGDDRMGGWCVWLLIVVSIIDGQDLSGGSGTDRPSCCSQQALFFLLLIAIII